eukprot:364441-Amphidinium_carterae.1
MRNDQNKQSGAVERLLLLQDALVGALFAAFVECGLRLGGITTPEQRWCRLHAQDAAQQPPPPASLHPCRQRPQWTFPVTRWQYPVLQTEGTRPHSQNEAKKGGQAFYFQATVPKRLQYELGSFEAKHLHASLLHLSSQVMQPT